MKKLLSLLTACTVITCIFVSCGEKKEDSSVSESSVSDTSVSETESSKTESSETAKENSSDESVVDFKGNKDDFIGKWQSVRLVSNGEELQDVAGLPVYAVFQYDICDDGIVKLPDSLMEVADKDNPVNYTWKFKSDNEIEINGSNNTSIVYTLKDGQLINADSTEEIYLEKVDEFEYFNFKEYYDKLMAQQDGQYVLTPVETDANGNIIKTDETTTAE